MVALIAIICSIIGSVIAAEFAAEAPAIARKIIDLAARSVDEKERDRYREEWLADLEERSGHITKIWHAVGCLFASAYMLPPLPKSNASQHSLVADDYIRKILRAKRMGEALKAMNNEFVDSSLEELKAQIDLLYRRLYEMKKDE